MSGSSRTPGTAIAVPGGTDAEEGPWIATVAHDEATGLLREAYDWQAARLGAPTEFTLLGSLHPPLVMERLRLYKTVDEVPSALTQLERAIAAFVTSTLNETAYCASGARLKVIANGLPEARLVTLERGLRAVLAAVRADPSVARPPAVQAARLGGRSLTIVRYATVLTLRPAAVGRRDITQLSLRGLGDLEILDLNDIVAYYCYINRVANGLGLRHPIADPAEAFHARPA